MEPSGSNLVQAGQYNFRLLFEECCKQEVEKEAGGGRGEGVETLAHQKIMLQRNKEPENTRSTNYLSLTGLSVFQVTSCDRQSFKGFIFSLGECTT